MKPTIKKLVASFAILAALYSFVPRPGGEGFEIYLNDKVLLQKFGTEMSEVSNLKLENASPAAKLIIKYHHCGKVGKNRMIVLKDATNRSLKEFHYPDVSTPLGGMSLDLKEINNFRKNGVVKLAYLSTELPNGRVLAIIQ